MPFQFTGAAPEPEINSTVNELFAAVYAACANMALKGNNTLKMARFDL